MKEEINSSYNFVLIFFIQNLTQFFFFTYLQNLSLIDNIFYNFFKSFLALCDILYIKARSVGVRTSNTI